MALPPELVDLAKSLPELVKEIYGDLAKPGVQQVGKAIGGVLGLGNTVLIPIHLANERSSIWLRHNLENYRKRMEDVPPESVTQAAPEIAIPILEKLAYVSNDELSNMYVNLLASASTYDGAKHAHPSFANIINNLSPDEALIIDKLSINRIPYHSVRFVNKEHGYITCNDFLIDFKQAKLTYPENCPAYFRNLAGLGLVELHFDTWVEDPYYAQEEAKWRPEFEVAFKGEGLRFHRCSITTTPLGHMLRNACINTKAQKAPH